MIVQKAMGARAQEWGLLGMRPEADWPRVFDYHTNDNRFTATILPGMMIAFRRLFTLDGYFKCHQDDLYARLGLGIGFTWNLLLWLCSDCAVICAGSPNAPLRYARAT